MNSGIHDAWSLKNALHNILNHNGNQDRLLNAFDSERRSIMRGFIQSQTIKNKKMMEATKAEAQRVFSAELKSTAENPALRREFLLKQSMIKCPNRAEAA